jgi:hypothetical protein
MKVKKVVINPDNDQMPGIDLLKISILDDGLGCSCTNAFAKVISSALKDGVTIEKIIKDMNSIVEKAVLMTNEQIKMGVTDV